MEDGLNIVVHVCCRLILVQAEIDKTWSDCVWVTDECESGYSVVSADWKLLEVMGGCRQLRRWRCKRIEDESGNTGPKARALEQMLKVNEHAPRAVSLGPDHMFREVPPSFVKSCSWEVREYMPLVDHEPLHMKEMRCMVCGLRHVVRGTPNWSRRHLSLGGNLGVMLSLSNGRCSDPQRLMLCRKWGGGLSRFARASCASGDGLPLS